MSDVLAESGFSQISLLDEELLSDKAVSQDNSVPKEDPRPANKLPPMLTQYLEYKSRYNECIIFFQVGDFYEVFFEDAVSVARVLNLTLTSRDKSSAEPVPMCGVPVHAIDSYLDRLVDQGFSAALVSQQNSSSLSRLPAAYKEENQASKVVISRQLSRIVTPGIRLLGEQSKNTGSSFILAVHFGQFGQAGLAYSDPQSGKIFVRAAISEAELTEIAENISPAEIIFPASHEGVKLDGRSSLARRLQRCNSNLVCRFREINKKYQTQKSDRPFHLNQQFQSLETDCKQAVYRLIEYIDETTIGARINFTQFMQDQADDCMIISSTARTNLEILASPTAGAQAGLYANLNNTKTAAGARLLKNWMLRPLRDLEKIHSRQEVVGFFLAQELLVLDLQASLELCPDLERIAARIELNCVGPKELGALRDVLRDLKNSPQLSVLREKHNGPGMLQQIADSLKIEPKLSEILERTLEEDLPPQLGDAWTIKSGFNSELDQHRLCQQDGRSWVQDFESREQSRTGISNLRVKFNYVLGYYIEVTKSQLSKIPTDYEKRQGTVNSERFVTAELKTKEKGVLGADELALALERKLYQELKVQLTEFCTLIRLYAEALAQLDVLINFAQLARKRNFIKPEVTAGATFLLEDGKHPVVESLLGSSFVPNSLMLDASSLAERDSKLPSALILTGPNMGGKSTFLRQAGVLTIMAQMGCYVPARRFRLGVVDQIFARIGASDDTAAGESTFMVEMREVVQIVNASSEKSLILIDEVGRGTSTKDGEALAQAIIEWLIEKKKCRILFATHFHSLTELSKTIEGLENICVAAVEHNREIIFTHQIQAGAAGQSYGLEVARLAGLPRDILLRSATIVKQNLTAAGGLVSDSSVKRQIFQALEDPGMGENEKKVLESLRQINLNSVTPLQALNLLNKLKSELDESHD